MTRRRLLSLVVEIVDSSKKVFNGLDPNFCAIPEICDALAWASIIKNDLRGNLVAKREEIFRAVHAVQDSVFHCAVIVNELYQVRGQYTSIWNGRSGTNMITEIITYDEKDKPVSGPIYKVHNAMFRFLEAKHVQQTILQHLTNHTKSRIIDIPLSLPHSLSDCAGIWDRFHPENQSGKASRVTRHNYAWSRYLVFIRALDFSRICRTRCYTSKTIKSTDGRDGLS